MANEQLFPNSTYPLTGDVQSQPGSGSITTTGIQTKPVSPQAPNNGQILIFDTPTNQYIPGDPIVSGPNATGTIPTANPVQIGGVDEGGRVRELQLDASGTLVSTNIESILKAILNEQRKTNILLMSAMGDSLEDDLDGDF